MSVYSGKSKIDLCRRLGNEWQDLADYFEIPAYHRRQFQQGHECQAIWEWLEARKRLQELPEALKDIEREDLLSVFEKTGSILFFLPDRGQQRKQLKETIEAYQVQYPDRRQRPLLCLIHGDENEYGNFVKCLLKDFFPNDFSEYFGNGPSEPTELLIDNLHTVAGMHQEILESLGNEVNAKPKKDAIASKFAQFRQPIVIHTYMCTKDLKNWQDEQKTIVDGFIEFWADWPKIYANNHLFLVFLTFRYEGKKNEVLSSSIVRNMFRWKSKTTTNLTIRKRFKALETKEESFEEKGVPPVVLPELKSVDWRAVYNWTKRYKKQLEKFWDDTYALELKVKALYENRDAIPMNELARELENLLTNPNQ